MTEARIYQALSSLGVDVYPMVAPQDATLPCITYLVVSERKKQVLDASIWAQSKRFQVDIWSESYKEAKELKEQAIGKLVELEAVDITARDLFEDDTKIYREIIEFYIKE